MSHRALAAQAAAEAQGDFEKAWAASCRTFNAKPDNEKAALLRGLLKEWVARGVLFEEIPVTASGVREAILIAAGDLEKEDEILREQSDPRENPTHVAGVTREMKKFTAAMKALVREACEAVKKRSE